MGTKEKVFSQKPYSKEFTSLVRELVASKKLEQKEIANKIGMNETSLSLVISGKRDIPFKKWEKFQELFKIENPDTFSARQQPEKHTQELIRLRAVTDILLKYVLQMRSSYYGRPLKDDVDKDGVIDEYDRDLHLQLQQLRNELL